MRLVPHRTLVVLCVMLLLLPLGPVVAAAVLVNIGNLRILKQLPIDAPSPVPFPHWDALPDEAAPLAEPFAAAHSLAPGLGSAQRGLVHSLLIAGQPRRAAEALSGTPVERVRQDRWLYIDAMFAFSYSGDAQAVIGTYQQLPLDARYGLDDLVAVAHLQKRTREDLLQALQVEPGNLYALGKLAEDASQRGDAVSAGEYAYAASHFPITAVHPRDARLVEFMVRAIADLFAAGTWDQAQLRRVVSFVTWQYPGAPAVERLLQDLSADQPGQAEWPFYLAELYHRRGDLQRAEAYYRAALTRDPQLGQASLRIGMLREAACANAEEPDDCVRDAAAWYRSYLSRFPEDALAQRLLAHAEGTSSTGDTEPGSNLVINGTFQDWQADGLPSSWIVANMASGPPSGQGACFAGPDDFSALLGTSVRVSCVWMDDPPGAEPARFGLWLWFDADGRPYAIQPKPSTRYLVRLSYRTRELPGGGAAITLLGFAPDRTPLPATDDAWHSHQEIRQAPPEAATVAANPLLQVWDPGDVWFDDVQLEALGR